MTSSADEPEILVEISDRIATISLNRPKSRNPMGKSFSPNMLAALDSIEADANVDVVVLTGKGPLFSCGGNLAEIMNSGTFDVEAQYESVRGFNKVTARLFNFDRPVIGAINGPAYGGAAVLGLACDFAFAADTAAYHFPFPRLGVSGADMGASTLLQRAIGPYRAAYYLQSGGSIDAVTGQQLGLFVEVVPQAELMDRVRQTAQAIAQGSRRATTITKMALRRAPETGLQAGLEYETYMQTFAFATDGHKERLAELQAKLRK